MYLDENIVTRATPKYIQPKPSPDHNQRVVPSTRASSVCSSPSNGLKESVHRRSSLGNLLVLW